MLSLVVFNRFTIKKKVSLSHAFLRTCQISFLFVKDLPDKLIYIFNKV